MRLFLAISYIFLSLLSKAQNKLYIPPALTGTNFNLDVQTGFKTFYGTTPTPTYGINGPWLSPTIIVNKGDSITLNVINNLPVKTTMHWHGLHVSAQNDGGPHQIIKANTTWSPSFKVRNNAATFWYHPHGAGQTEAQVSKGLAGLFIVKDAEEALLNLPRTYGIDDIPIIIQTRAFDELQQIAIASEMDTSLFVNGTLNALLEAPQQVVRFRLLNGSSLRTYNMGLSNNQSFYQIATDGGLLDSSLLMSRLRLSPGERAEILINFSGMLGQSIYLKSYASELPNGVYGADSLGNDENEVHDYQNNYLNGSDFNLLQFKIVTTTTGAIASVPNSLVVYQPFNKNSATQFRRIIMDTIRLLSFEKPNRAEGPFGMNHKSFDMEVINEIVHINTTEIWTLVNKTMVAHPFHIHDIQFNILEKSGILPPRNERGWKDVVLVMPNDSVKFITKFTTFADSQVPYMYHCHLLHHEDDGMMGSFTVIDTSTNSIIHNHSAANNGIQIFPLPANQSIFIQYHQANQQIKKVVLTDVLGSVKKEIMGRNLNSEINISDLTPGTYYLTFYSEKFTQTKKIIKQ